MLTPETTIEKTPLGIVFVAIHTWGVYIPGGAKGGNINSNRTLP